MRNFVTGQDTKPFMSVKQVAEYLNLNEKKVYTLVNEGRIPGTKVTGKWMFPRELIDRWMLESSHGGVLTDRLVIMGSDDPLLFRLVLRYSQEIRAHALRGGFLQLRSAMRVEHLARDDTLDTGDVVGEQVVEPVQETVRRRVELAHRSRIIVLVGNYPHVNR